MRRSAAIFFLSLMLLAQTPLQQVLRLPFFVEHFREHRAEKPGFSLTDFIVLHYFSGNPKYKDYDRDMQLPLRAHDIVLINSTVVVPEQVQPDFAPLVFEQKTYPLLHVENTLSNHPFAIFQPPRAC